MYGFANATLVANTKEELEKMIEPYRKYPFFQQSTIRETTHKFVYQGKYMVVLNYFNND